LEKLDAAIKRARGQNTTDQLVGGGDDPIHDGADLSCATSNMLNGVNVNRLSQILEVDDIASMGFVSGFDAGREDAESHLVHGAFPAASPANQSDVEPIPETTPIVHDAGLSLLRQVLIYRDAYLAGYKKGKEHATLLLACNNFTGMAEELRNLCRETEY